MLTEQQADSMLILLSSKVPVEELSSIREELLKTDKSYQTIMLLNTQLKDPIITIVLSIIVGYLGIDRLYLGDIGLGLGKLFTCGGLYIWWLVDIFLVMDTARQHNFQRLMATL